MCYTQGWIYEHVNLINFHRSPSGDIKIFLDNHEDACQDDNIDTKTYINDHKKLIQVLSTF